MTSRPVRPAGWSHRGLLRASLLALALYALGAGAHFRHHLIDPACEGSGSGAPHACVTCQALHGGVLSAAAAPTLAAVPYVGVERHLPETQAVAGVTVGIRTARAPPLS